MSTSIRASHLTICFALLAGGCGGGTTATMSGAVYRVTPSGGGIDVGVAANTGFSTPDDTVPSSDASTFYFVATTPDGKPAVWKTTGGGSATVLAAGSPLVSPLGISISGDDKTLYVADPGAGLFQLSASGGAPTLIAGTDCMKPRGVDVQSQGGADQIYFTTSASACGGGAGLAKVAATGGMPSFVASGAAFKVPTGVAVARSGDIYVSNPGADAPASGNVLKVSGGVATELVGGIGFGHPAGIALDVANTTLFVSSIDGSGHDQVYAIVLATKMSVTFNATIGANTSGGGLHRAAARDVFSWADTKALPMGPIIIKL